MELDWRHISHQCCYCLFYYVYWPFKIRLQSSSNFTQTLPRVLISIQVMTAYQHLLPVVAVDLYTLSARIINNNRNNIVDLVWRCLLVSNVTLLKLTFSHPVLLLNPCLVFVTWASWPDLKDQHKDRSKMSVCCVNVNIYPALRSEFCASWASRVYTHCEVERFRSGDRQCKPAKYATRILTFIRYICLPVTLFILNLQSKFCFG